MFLRSREAGQYVLAVRGEARCRAVDDGTRTLTHGALLCSKQMRPWCNKRASAGAASG